VAIAISPRHTTDDFRNGWTLDSKIEVFVARVEGWQLGVAREVIDKGISHRGFALLLIITSYFEMIAKYQDGFMGEGKSGYYFKKGILNVYPSIAIALPTSDDLLDSFYSNVRNGLYHVGLTRAGVLLSDDISGSIGFDTKSKQLVISPDRLVGDLQTHFGAYATALRNPANSQLRRNFESRFDSDNS
jgi:hypothetical protein